MSSQSFGESLGRAFPRHLTDYESVVAGNIAVRKRQIGLRGTGLLILKRVPD